MTARHRKLPRLPLPPGSGKPEERTQRGDSARYCEEGSEYKKKADRRHWGLDGIFPRLKLKFCVGINGMRSNDREYGDRRGCGVCLFQTDGETVRDDMSKIQGKAEIGRELLRGESLMLKP